LARQRGAVNAPAAGAVEPSGLGEPGDLALVTAALADPRAFAPLYRRYAEPVYRYCYRRVSDPDLAADLTASIFTRAIERLPTFRRDGADTFRAWLFAIARNAVIDTYRRGRSEGALPVDSPDDDPGPETLAVHRDELDRLLAVLHRIPEQHRQIIELRLAGLTAAEIASMLGLTRAAVKSAQTRAYSRLRELLSEPPATTEVPS